MAKVTMKDFEGSFQTCFIFDKGNGESVELWVPVNQADSFKTAIQGASWTQIQNLYDREGETIIKST